SFRSSDAILRLVDLIFETMTEAGFQTDGRHRAFKSDLPGRVDLWPVVEKTSDDDDREWTDPVDRPGARHHSVVLAEQIATGIRDMIKRGETVPKDGQSAGSFVRRPVRPGDFLILVQRRSDLFAEIIRACKSFGLPIAGADRLKVGAELAVKDLAAVLNVLATPEDSLALATALRSPLFGWSEQQLFDLAHRREEEYLWAALRRRSDEFPQTMAILNDLRGQTDFLRPYDLIERILTRHDGRRQLLGRLGAEAEDGINALLSQALAYERSDIPSLTGFLSWLETDDLEIKRQMTGVGNMIRVMTVHGAKGLESPIVILPDTGARRAPADDDIISAAGTALWQVRQDESPGVLAEARSQARTRQLAERMRLLYVALTRAEKWLIVAAAGDLGKGGDSWYDLVRDAMVKAGATRLDDTDVLRLSHADWTTPPLHDHFEPTPVPSPIPDLFQHDPEPELPGPEIISPSDLGGAKALPGEAGLDEEAAKLRGSQIHLLLEHLPSVPSNQRAMRASELLAPESGETWQSLLGEVTKVLDKADLAWLFRPDSLAEVPVTATVGQVRLHGIIDRLVVEEGVVWAVDFKTNALVPETAQACPQGLLRQMGAYAAALKQIYPEKRVRVAILWTRTASLMELPHDLVTESLNATQIS
ncbi:MAG: 3'-5' exonuclease, partial [Pseudomonadota bacterium]